MSSDNQDTRIVPPKARQPETNSRPSQTENRHDYDSGPSLFETLITAISRYFSISMALIFRPFSTLKAGVVDPPVSALSPTELIIWALPPTMAISASYTLGSFAANHFTGAILINIVGALTLAILIGGITALLIAVIWHPFIGLIIRIFGGASDARLRSNVFIAHSAAITVLAFAYLFGSLLSLMPFKFAAYLPFIFSFFAFITLLRVWHAWRDRLAMNGAFDVLLVLSGIAFVGFIAYSMLTSELANPQTLATEKVKAELNAASASLKQAQEKLAEVTNTATIIPLTSPKEQPQYTAKTSLAEFKKRRAYIDDTITRDRTIFERVTGLAQLYAKLQKDTVRAEKELEKKYRRKKRKQPPIIPERKRDLLLQARTAKQVDSIYKLLTAPKP
ncbi:MAG: hypothetical protein JW841_08300 [Deltaproteobacteria bacterium]|nr:hypothetical protein [Deltaproteobacteria bacterium]